MAEKIYARLYEYIERSLALIAELYVDSIKSL